MKNKEQVRADLLNKLKNGDFLSKEESDELGPLISRDLAPKTGDSFIEMIEDKIAKRTNKV